jgi:hypothetical protein
VKWGLCWRDVDQYEIYSKNFSVDPNTNVLWFVSSCVTICRLCFSGFWCLGVCLCVCARARACLGLYAILVCPRFLCVVICTVAVSPIATCVLLASRVYVCVRPGRLLCGL